MNYQKHYNNLISTRSKLVRVGYLEVHHIIPRCLGGNDDITNLIKLTAREHFIAHLLLAKIYKGNSSLLFALNLMKNTRDNVTSYSYEKLKVDISKTLSKIQSGNIWSYNPDTKIATFSKEVPTGNILGRPTKDVIGKKQFSNNTSGTTGVFYRKDTGQWRATIKIKNIVTSLGSYLNKEDAIKARKLAEATMMLDEHY